MYRKRIIKALNDRVEELTGCKIGESYIQTDRSGAANYIPAHSLERGYPVIITHLYGIRLMFIPHEDWDALMLREITPHEYVDTAIWNYGYYWGFNTLEDGGVYWQPLEDGEPGIHDKEKVYRYLTILKCRAYEKKHKESPMMIWCSECHLKKCPMSVLKRKKLNTSWDDEVQEHHVRQELYEFLKEMIKKRFGLEVYSLGINWRLNETPKTIYLSAGYKPGTVKVSIGEKLFTDMMYHPKKYNIKKWMEKAKLVACVEEYSEERRNFLPCCTMVITSHTTREDLNEFWGHE